MNNEDRAKQQSNSNLRQVGEEAVLLHKLLNLRPKSQLELWGGVECTFNRVGNIYYDELEWTGHSHRLSDLDLFAKLGIRAIRYPVLWEKVAPQRPDQFDWQWTDERIRRLEELGIKPIATLLHHGNGPRYTSLIDPEFPQKFARYARAVAERYPHLEYYTPLNEPLTTARFSGLYGHWYPHATDNLSFARLLIRQCRAIILAMHVIRRVNPNAKLVQTEDVGRTYSTEKLAYQATFENHRRWLSLDLLSGRVHRHHPLWKYLTVEAGVMEHELAPLWEEYCPPDLIGVDYYLASDRFLDDRVELYPEEFRGGNGRHEYADVPAVRASSAGIAGVGAVLREAWDRYRIPVAVTEAHLNCTREEQMRWLWEVWQEAEAARDSGVDVRAVTVWSLLGAYNWNTLVTRDINYYESGVYDLRKTDSPHGGPGATALLPLAQQLANGERPSHPVLFVPGWWRQPRRLLYEPANPSQQHPYQAGVQRWNLLGNLLRDTRDPKRNLHGARNSCYVGDGVNQSLPEYSIEKEAQPILIVGANGPLGQALARACEIRHLPHHGVTRHDLDATNDEELQQVIAHYRPWAIINAAGYNRVNEAERETKRCFCENVTVATTLAKHCAAHGIKLLTFSSDLVFDGNKQEPYVESDPVAPINTFGRSKVLAEQGTLKACPNALIIRSGAVFGPWDEYNFVTMATRVLGMGRKFVVAGDATISPTYLPDLVHTCLDLMIDDECGVWHLSNKGESTWSEMARYAARLMQADERLIEVRPARPSQRAEPPAYSVLGSERGQLLPSLEDALQRYFTERVEYMEKQRSIRDADIRDAKNADQRSVRGNVGAAA